MSLAKPVLRAVADQGYTTATPIQAESIPPILEGRDLLGCAQTGTGKTAAFALPILDRLSQSKAADRRPRCLVLCPTRELAGQIAESFRDYGRHLKLRHALVFGGVGQYSQVRALRAGIDILIATPGRLLDLMNQGHVDLSAVTTLVLDEADRMLDMGFLPDIRRVTAAIPKQRQTLLFSATMPGPIRTLAHDLLKDPVSVEIVPQATTVERIEQGVYFVDQPHKIKLLTHLLGKLPIQRAIVFTRTKHGADKVVKLLSMSNIHSAAIHGNKSQNARERALAIFKKGKINVLVATDIASRGIDVDGVSHVFNFDLTNEPESYVHRIGRTARAGASGIAVSFCNPEERGLLRAIERTIRLDIPRLEDQPSDIPASVAPMRGGGNTRPARRGPKPQHANAGGGGGRRGKRPASRGGSGGNGQSRGGGEGNGGPRGTRRRRKI
ncbi:MAG: DEAD/DEAH box helicase [Phycisphaeraceae bacterium]